MEKENKHEKNVERFVNFKYFQIQMNVLFNLIGCESGGSANSEYRE